MDLSRIREVARERQEADERWLTVGSIKVCGERRAAGDVLRILDNCLIDAEPLRECAEDGFACGCIGEGGAGVGECF